MSAGEQGRAPDSFDSPDGRTYSEPVTAATPGQAAYEAFQLAFPGEDWGSWALCGMTDEENQPGWERIGQAAIDVFLAGDSVSAESIREAVAAQDARPAPEPEVQFAPCPVDGHDGKHMQWRSGQWTCGHVLANSLILGGILPVPGPLTVKPSDDVKPAPELAAEGTPPDVRPRADGRRGMDITCGSCGEDYGTNVTDADEIECPECEARRCPHCLTWYGGNS